MRFVIVVIISLSVISVNASSNIVMITLQDESEDFLGLFPVSRNVYSNAIDTLANQGAKSVILKFFIDQSNNIAEEKELAESLKRLPVIMQAELNNDKNVNIPVKIVRKIPHNLSSLPNYSGGFFPLNVLSREAKFIGYGQARLDSDFTKIDLLSTYNNALVSSIVLNTIEEVLNRTATLDGNILSIGDLKIPITEEGMASCEYTESKDIPIFSFSDLLTNKIASKDLNGKVVILGYMRKDAPRYKYGFLNMKTATSHELFSKQVSCLLSYE